MRRLLLLATLTAAILATVVAAPVQATIGCTAAGKTPVFNSQGFLSAHYAVNCTNGQSWTGDATVQALIGSTWERAANTGVATTSSSGDATVTAPVETGAWACVTGRSYRTHVVLRNGNTDNSGATTLC